MDSRHSQVSRTVCVAPPLRASREDIQVDVVQDRLEPGVKRPGTSASNNTGTSAFTGANASLSTPPTPTAAPPSTPPSPTFTTAARALVLSQKHRLLHLRLSALRKATDDLRRPQAHLCEHSALTQADIASRAQELLDDINFLYAGGAAHTGIYRSRLILRPLGYRHLRIAFGFPAGAIALCAAHYGKDHTTTLFSSSERDTDGSDIDPRQAIDVSDDEAEGEDKPV
ncbi:hypothetical protein GGX14DRAFT_561778 [Mycena pura]|uniref:Uncharacterized protein n=1 Tax=Mycena pura TaxID=153505 RepID=A0AAD6VNE0_9AGAR|nr:hypothetical protein GGX14DRAFT_561778 [Mycena pura]